MLGSSDAMLPICMVVNWSLGNAERSKHAGRYSSSPPVAWLQVLKGEHTAKTLPKTTMKVTQSAGRIEIVESFDDGKTLTRKYALDGSESKNLTSGGVPTTDRAEIKGKTLVIRSSYRLLTGDTVHETEKWNLSADSKTIKIRHQMQFERMFMLDDTLNEIYQRQ
jgi:hypothetical protein